MAKIKVIKKNDEYSSDYKVGDILEEPTEFTIQEPIRKLIHLVQLNRVEETQDH